MGVGELCLLVLCSMDVQIPGNPQGGRVDHNHTGSFWSHRDVTPLKRRLGEAVLQGRVGLVFPGDIVGRRDTGGLLLPLGIRGSQDSTSGNMSREWIGSPLACAGLS